jgi:uncharacterized protein YdeI (YjbR/CyaY-like superfamily)
MAGRRPELDELAVPGAEAWREWLAAHHDRSPGVWLVLRKKDSPTAAPTYAEALDEALCFGWIDGQGRRRDEATTFVRFTPRRPRSIWSARNVGHVARLEQEGRMRPAGRAAVEAAKADGRWDAAYGGPDPVEVPAELAAAIAANPDAQAMFHVLTKTNRVAVVGQVTTARRPETRARRIEQLVTMLARHETPFPQKARPG